MVWFEIPASLAASRGGALGGTRLQYGRPVAGHLDDNGKGPVRGEAPRGSDLRRYGRGVCVRRSQVRPGDFASTVYAPRYIAKIYYMESGATSLLLDPLGYRRSDSSGASYPQIVRLGTDDRGREGSYVTQPGDRPMGFTFCLEAEFADVAEKWRTAPPPAEASDQERRIYGAAFMPHQQAP